LAILKLNCLIYLGGTIGTSPFASSVSEWNHFAVEYHYSPTAIIAIRSTAHGNKLFVGNHDGHALFEVTEGNAIPDTHKWSIQQLSDGKFSLQNVASRKYLCLDGGHTFVANREAVGDWEKFVIEPKGGNSFSLLSAPFSKYLCDAPGRPETRDAANAWEQFTFEYFPLPSVAYIPPRLQSHSDITFRNFHGVPATADPNGGIHWNAKEVNAWEKFTVEDVGDGKVAIRSAHGKYLSAEPGRFIWDREHVGAWEQFSLFVGLGNKVRIFSDAHGPRYVCATLDGKTEIREHGGPWETFSVEYH